MPTGAVMYVYQERTGCRSCGSSLEPMLSLGEQALPAWLEGPDSDYLAAPLNLAICTNRDCRLLQLEHSVDPDLLWRDADYGYHSGINETMRHALANITQAVRAKVRLGPGDVVVDIGANDGTLLKTYPPGCIKIGYDPVRKFESRLRKVCDYAINDYFSAITYPRGEAPAKAVTAAAMFYDLDDPTSFLEDIQEIMDDDGIFVIQLSYLPLMLFQTDFLCVCHEHRTYYSLQSLEYLLARNGLRAFDASINEINGGSLRLFIDKGRRSQSFMLYALRKWEQALGLDMDKPYRDFAFRAASIRDELRQLVGDAISSGRKVYGYTASTKGSVLLQYCGFGPSEIEALVERNLEKIGRYLAGTGIPIISEKEARQDQPDYFLVLAWAFMDEFRQRERDWHDKGGRFIVPLPEVTVE
jgi:NDP-4-keto-2,6-dideoxyhexose 3-C-methyltransferase